MEDRKDPCTFLRDVHGQVILEKVASPQTITAFVCLISIKHDGLFSDAEFAIIRPWNCALNVFMSPDAVETLNGTADGWSKAHHCGEADSERDRYRQLQ